MFERGEKEIANSDADNCIEYANIIGGRFELGEKTISTNYRVAMDYVISHMNGTRFIEFEKYIISKKMYSAIIEYCKILKIRMTEIEKCLLDSKKPSYLCQYVKHVIKGDWPEAEKFIMLDINYMVDYAPAIGHRMKEWENKIKTDTRLWIYYTSQFKISTE